MDASPLTQLPPPESFQPKIVRLYETLFREDEGELDLSKGFWEEFFLLRPDAVELKRILRALSPDDMLQLQARSQLLFQRSIARAKQGVAPSDEAALDTLTVFLDAVLAKKYTNPSSDIISVLAGLHDADAVLSEFVACLDTVLRSGRGASVKRKAVRTALVTTAGASHTGLISYFTHRDLFPSLMKYVHECDECDDVLPALYLLGLLANYNKFEFQNPYRMRLDDFVNDAIIQKMITCFGTACLAMRDAYILVQDDMPEGWNLTSTLSYFGLGALAPTSRPSSPSTPNADDSGPLFAALPGPEAGLLLATYDFINANKLFCFNFANLAPAKKSDASPLGAFLSLTSYLFQHAHRSYRSSRYTYLCLFILHILAEDQILIKRLCSEESKLVVRLCRQRQPFLPVVKGDRVAAAVVLDLMMDGINHNLRRKLDADFYVLCLGIVLRIISFLSRARVRLAFHWSELWRSLLSFVRFLSTYAPDIKQLPKSDRLIDDVVNLVAFALTNGENFLPDPASYDDLVYKLVEMGDMLAKFRDVFGLASRPSSSSIKTLMNVSSHYHALLQDGSDKGKLKSTNLSPREVSLVIKQGYETLSIHADEGLDRWEKFREQDYKPLLKKIARAAVDDARCVVDEK